MTEFALATLAALPKIVAIYNQPSQALFLKNGFKKWAHLPDVAELDGQPASLDILGKHY